MNRRLWSSLTVFAFALSLSGCGRAVPTSPDVNLDSAAPARPLATAAATPVTTVTAGLPIVSPVLKTITDEVETLVPEVRFITDPSRVALPGPVVYVPTAATLALPGIELGVNIGRWSLDFHPGSLNSPKLITVAQASDGTMRVQFGPEGTQFAQPVDVTINYAGTSLDPDSPTYVRGTVPQFVYFDPNAGTWVEMPCTVDAAHKTIHTQLHHFSRYGVGGKAGW